MDDFTKRNFLLTAKQKYLKHQWQDLLVPQDPPYPPVHYDVNQVLVSQFLVVMNDDSFLSLNNDLGRLPLSILYAALIRCYQMQNHTECLKILQGHLEKHYQVNKHVLLFNIAKIYHEKEDFRKAIFYLELAIKDKPLFETGIYEHCKRLSENGRKVQALSVVRRHVNGSFSNSANIQSLYLSLLAANSKGKKHSDSDYQTTLKQVLRIFHKKQVQFHVAFNLGLFFLKMHVNKRALEVFCKLQEQLLEFYQQKAPYKSKKLLIMTRINIAKLRQQEERPNYQLILDIYEALQKDIPYEAGLKQKIFAAQGALKRYSNAVQRLNKSKNSLLNEDLKNGIASDETKQNFKPTVSTTGLKDPELDEAQFKKLRKKNQEKLQFLLGKEKEINQFFKNFQISKTGNGLKASKVRHQKLAQSVKFQLISQNGKYSEFQNEFEEKKLKHQIKYTNQELQQIINSYFSNVFPNKKFDSQKQRVIKNVHNSFATLSLSKPQTSTKKFRIKNNITTSHEKLSFKRETTDAVEQKSEQKIQEKEQPEIPVRQPTRKITRMATLKQSKQSVRIIENEFQRTDSELNTTNTAINEFETSMHNSKENSTQKQGMFATTDRRGNTHHPLAMTDFHDFGKKILIGQKLEAAKKYQQAYGHYSKMYKDFKREKDKQKILLKIGNLFEIQERTEEAQKTFLKCTKLNNAEAFMRLGGLQMKLGRITDGVQNLEKANCIERFNTQIETKLVYGYSLREQTIDKAFSLASTILKRNPDSLQALIMSANILQKKGKIREALEIAHAIDDSRESVQVKHYIGLLYLNDSNVPQAFKYFQQALRLKPKHVPSLIEVGTILSDLRPKDSIKVLRKAIELQPNNKLALARLGKIYEEEGDYENAMLIYKRSLEVQPNYESYVKIGDCMHKKDCLVEAYLNYKEALFLQKTPQVYEKIAEVYKEQGQYRKAYDSYQTALSLLDPHSRNKQRKRCLINSGITALKLHDYDNAILPLKQILEFEETGEQYKNLGDAYYGKGDYTESLEYYQKALKIIQNETEEQDWDLLQKIALCLDRRQQYLASKAIYEKIIQRFPDNVRALNNLACILLLTGDTNEAFYWFENMLLKVPHSIDKRLKVVDNYVQVGDWSKVEHHLLICYKQKENDIRILEKLVNLYKEKRDNKQVAKFQKKYNLLKTAQAKKQKEKPQ